MKPTPLLLCLAAFAPALCQADWLWQPYVGAGVEAQQIEVAEAEFDNTLLSAQAGAWLLPGIGLEVEFAQALEDDTAGSVSVEHSQSLRYGLRLASPPTREGAVLYVLLSGAQATIDMQTNGNGFPGETDFAGYHAAVGFGSQLSKHWLVDLSYHNYQVDESLDIHGLRLSVQYQLPELAR